MSHPSFFQQPDLQLHEPVIAQTVAEQRVLPSFGFARLEKRYGLIATLIV
jgi:hypothetical protein